MSDVEQHFVESISYLRRLGFFEEYLDLTSGEILEKLKEKWSLKSLGEDWMGKSVFEIDRFLAIDDRRRTWFRDCEISVLGPGVNAEILRELASISHGVLQPEDIEEVSDDSVSFTFQGRRHIVKFNYSDDFLNVDSLLWQLNRIIENTGYRYYSVTTGDQCACVVVLTDEEAKRLMDERGWDLSLWLEEGVEAFSKDWVEGVTERLRSLLREETSCNFAVEKSGRDRFLYGNYYFRDFLYRRRLLGAMFVTFYDFKKHYGSRGEINWEKDWVDKTPTSVDYIGVFYPSFIMVSLLKEFCWNFMVERYYHYRVIEPSSVFSIRENRMKAARIIPAAIRILRFFSQY
ncbi:MAG: hypothetical protein FGF53_04120 [Candidatus Brockarchaeota archaeon]|nr:hypothetical protein [Candidatus Brockarchaeota archaeon]MBO3809605.1 hypothetical protein [Candidatus Brockarchaeota archaeon]